MRIAIAIVIAFGCQGRGTESKRAPGSAAAVPADPWSGRSGSDEPPSLDERHRLVEEACARVTAPHFFRVEKDGRVAHVLGTRHISVSLDKFPAVVRDEIAAAKLAVFESPSDDGGPPSQAEVSIRDELGPVMWERYRKLVGERAARSVERARPIEAFLVVLVMYENPGAMLDKEIKREVARRRIPTRGLETSALQDELLAKHMGMKALRGIILSTDHREELADESRRDIAAYCAGTDDTPGFDERERAELMQGGYTVADIDQMEEELVYTRNRDWIPKLETIFETDGAFVAVGADHLRGDKGVIELLRARGYRITRVDPSPR